MPRGPAIGSFIGSFVSHPVSARLWMSALLGMCALSTYSGLSHKSSELSSNRALERSVGRYHQTRNSYLTPLSRELRSSQQRFSNRFVLQNWDPMGFPDAGVGAGGEEFSQGVFHLGSKISSIDNVKTYTLVYGNVPAILDHGTGNNAEGTNKIKAVWTFRGLRGHESDDDVLEEKLKGFDGKKLEEYKTTLAEDSNAKYLAKHMVRLKTSEKHDTVLEAAERYGRSLLDGNMDIKKYVSIMARLHKKTRFERKMRKKGTIQPSRKIIKKGDVSSAVEEFHHAKPGLVCSKLVLMSVELCFDTNEEPVNCPKARYNGCPEYIKYLNRAESSRTAS